LSLTGERILGDVRAEQETKEIIMDSIKRVARILILVNVID
jgi:hypothetical protein